MEEQQSGNDLRARNVIKAGAVAAIGGVLIVVTIISTLFWGSGKNEIFTYIGQIGDITGGVAGAILNFSGLLIVYFSLREQLLSNKIQSDALRNEIAKSKYDNEVKGVERSIELAMQEIHRQTDVLEKWSEYVLRIHELLEGTYYENDLRDLIRELKKYDYELAVLASLLFIANKKIEESNLEVDDKSYCIEKFFFSCITQLQRFKGATHPGRTLRRMEASSAYLYRIATDFKFMREKFHKANIPTLTNTYI